MNPNNLNVQTESREIIETFEMSKVRARPFSQDQSRKCSSSIEASFNEPVQAASRRIPPNLWRIRFRCDVCIATPSILNNLDDSDFLRGIYW